MRALVRNSTGKGIQWRGFGHSVGRRALWVEIFCTRFSAKICTLQMLEFPGEGVNLQNLRMDLRKSAFWALSLSLSLCHLSSVPLSAPRLEVALVWNFPYAILPKQTSKKIAAEPPKLLRSPSRIASPPTSYRSLSGPPGPNSYKSEKIPGASGPGVCKKSGKSLEKVSKNVRLRLFRGPERLFFWAFFFDFGRGGPERLLQIIGGFATPEELPWGSLSQHCLTYRLFSRYRNLSCQAVSSSNMPDCKLSL